MFVFVHGWACNNSHWRLQLKAFADQHCIVAPNLAGHGDSGIGARDWTMKNFAKDVQAVIDDLDLTEWIIVGHSMGARSL